MKIDNGGSAFPLPYVFSEIQGLKYKYETGISLRDYFAGQALCGLAANTETISVEYASEVVGIVKDSYKPEIHWPMFCAKRAYGMADAMLAERSKQKDIL